MKSIRATDTDADCRFDTEKALPFFLLNGKI